MVTTRRTTVGGRGGTVAAICLAGIIGLGCAETLQKAAESAAPGAVEGATEEAQEPDTRADIARVLSDPKIRSAIGSLSSEILAGTLAGLTDEQRSRQLHQLTEGMVQSVGASLAKTMRDDIGPQLSKSLADAVDRSLERALDAETEQRLEAMAVAVTRGMLTGVGQTLVDSNAQPSPAWGQLIGRIARDATHDAAFGLDDAIRHAESDARDEPPRVLAALGTLSTLAQALPWLIAGGLLLLLIAGALPMGWLVLRARHYRRQSLAHEEAALALARAIKAAEPLAWSNELREHLARQNRDAAGADELARLLREHAELRLTPRERAPHSERGAHA